LCALFLYLKMVTNEEVVTYALTFPEAIESPHFEKKSFRVRKKIFATLDVPKKRVVVKFTLLQQSVFCDSERLVIYPVPGGWGRQGWTIVELKKVRKVMFKDALIESYCNVAPKALQKEVKSEK